MFRFISLQAAICAVALWAAAAGGLPPAQAQEGAGSNGDGGMRLVNIPPAKTSGPLDLWIARTKVKLPTAVLILCPDRAENIKALLAAPAWQHFAEDHNLGLVALMEANAPPSTRNPPPSPLSRTTLVVQAMDREFGSGIPLVLYAWPQQTALAESLVASNPKRVLTWCLRSPRDIPNGNGSTPPGVVICDKENKPTYDRLLREFTLGRKEATRLTWIALPGESLDDWHPDVDAFVRSYCKAVFSYKPGLEQWENIDTKQPISAQELNASPATASYLPHPVLATAWRALHVPGGPDPELQAVSEREEDTFNPAQPKLHLYLRKPVSAEQTGGRIEGVLAFCTWQKDKASLVGRLHERNDPLVRYADQHHLALLTWDTAQAWNARESADQRSQQEKFQDDLGFDKLANAWERGVHVLCHDAGLPENDFLLYGISRGAQWAHRLALRKPEHFLAVHIHISSSYDWPTPAAKNILWLQTTGDREAGYEAAKRFYERCRNLGYPIIFKAGENLDHNASAQIDALGLRFFDYALSVKARRDTMAANPKTLRGQHDLPGLYALSGLAEAPFYADFINQDVYGADEKDMVPVGQRVPLPTKALAQAWGGSAETPALLAVSNPVAVPAKSVTVKPSSGPATLAQGNYFGSTTPPAPPSANVPGSTAIPPAVDVAKQDGRPSVVASPPKPEAAPTPVGQDFADRYRLAVQHAVTDYPALALAGSVPNIAFLGQYQQLKNSNDALLADPSWPEQVARLVRERAAAHPDFAREFKASIERAVLVYPALAQADSPMNAAFLNEYQRLQAAGAPFLTDPTWPEQVARRASEKLTAQPSR